MASHRSSNGRALAEKWFCAAAAASIAETVTMPLDVAKVRFQLQRSGQLTGQYGHVGAPITPNTSLFSMMRSIVRNEGGRALWRGVVPAVLRQSLCGGIGVGFYQPVKDGLMRATSTPDHVPGMAPLHIKVAAASCTGILGQIMAAPTDVVKVRLQSDNRALLTGGVPPRYSGTLNAFVRIATDEGIMTLYRGMLPSIQRAAFMYGASTATYDHAKQLVTTHSHYGDRSVVAHVTSSCISGLMASLVSTPFDVIKTRLIAGTPTHTLPTPPPAAPPMSSPVVPMVHHSAQSHAHVHIVYSGAMDCMMKTVRDEGMSALMKGWLPTYLRLAPWQLCFFILYEQLSIAVTGHTFTSSSTAPSSPRSTYPTPSS